MGPDFQAIPGAEGWQLSNPPIFQLAALRASLDVFDRAGIKRLREKSKLISSFLEKGISEELPKVQLMTPKDPERRGTQLSLRLQHAPKELVGKLNKANVICDFREPDIIRLAPCPLYTRYQDTFQVVQILKKILGDT